MIGHTLGPWKVVGSSVKAGRFNICSRVTAGGAAAGMLDARLVEHANARRIVACVNACDGLPTDDLERFGWSLITKLRDDEAMNVVRQRDELLAALKHLEHNARKSGANMGLALDAARAAITKAEAVL